MRRTSRGPLRPGPPSNRSGHRSCAPYFTYRHVAAVPAHPFVDIEYTMKLKPALRPRYGNARATSSGVASPLPLPTATTRYCFPSCR